MCNEKKKKVIDYNQMISEKISLIQNKLGNACDEVAATGEFVEGIDAESVEKLLTEDSDDIHDNIEANERASQIIELANSDAEAIIENAKAECESIKQSAVQAGKAEGYNSGKIQALQEIEQKKQEIELEKKRLSDEYEKKAAQIEPMLVDTILEVFAKVTHVLSEDKKDLVLQLVQDAITKNEFSSDFLIRVSTDDYKFIIDNKEKIDNSVSEKVHVEIVEDPTFSRGQCMIESDGGIYDCSLDIQLENLINSIKIMSCMSE